MMAIYDGDGIEIPQWLIDRLPAGWTTFDDGNDRPRLMIGGEIVNYDAPTGQLGRKTGDGEFMVEPAWSVAPNTVTVGDQTYNVTGLTTDNWGNSSDVMNLLVGNNQAVVAPSEITAQGDSWIAPEGSSVVTAQRGTGGKAGMLDSFMSSGIPEFIATAAGASGLANLVNAGLAAGGAGGADALTDALVSGGFGDATGGTAGSIFGGAEVGATTLTDLLANGFGDATGGTGGSVFPGEYDLTDALVSGGFGDATGGTGGTVADTSLTDALVNGGFGDATGGTAGGVFGGGTVGGGLTLNQVMQGLNGAKTLSQLLGVTGGAASALDALGLALPGLVEAYGASQQGDALGDLISADNARYQSNLALGAPSRSRFEGSFAPGFDITQDPALRSAMEGTTDTLLRRLSAEGGNPWGNPGGLAEVNRYVTQNVALPYLNQYRSTNASAGGFPGFSQAAAQGPNTNLAASQIGANAGIWGGLGDAAASIFTPKKTLADILKGLA